MTSSGHWWRTQREVGASGRAPRTHRGIRQAATGRVGRVICALGLSGLAAVPIAVASDRGIAGEAVPGSGATTLVRIPPDRTPAVLPILDVRARVLGLTLPTANLDGSLTDFDGRHFRLDADLLFRFDRAELTPKADAVIAQLTQRLRAANARWVRIDGHTDSVGGTAYNLRLSRARAQAVADRLSDEFGSQVRLRVRGHGEDDPVASNESEQGRALNRRVTVVVEK